MVVVYGLSSHGGLNMVDLSVEQEIRGISNLLYHLYVQDSISKLIQIYVQASKLESGQFEQVMMNTHLHIPYLNQTWITNIRGFMAQHDLCIETTENWTLKPHFPHDRGPLWSYSQSQISATS